jgi:ATP-dependent DNA helicase RecG
MDGDYLKRAATLLFYAEPEKFVTGSYIKIGYFKSDSELIYQDKIDGNLFEQVDKCIDLIFTKYLKAIISYDGIQRVESFPVSELAFREAIINAVVHKDYSELTPIQISVYDDKLLIWNTGELPEHWTIDTLKQKHPSKPYNPAIANVFFLAGFIESWGRGIDKITQESEKFNNITPNFRMDNGLWVEFNFNTENDGLGEKLGERLGERFGEKLTENRQLIVETMMNTPLITIAQLSSSIGISTTAIENNINYLKNNNYIKRVGGDKGGHWEVIE